MPLLAKYDIPQHFDLLSIDIDGNDYWIWDAITATPRVVVIEYNSSILPPQRKSITYNPTFRWDGTEYYGASLSALEALGRRKGYRLLYCDARGVNAFFVLTELCGESFPATPIDQLYRRRRHRHRPDKRGRVMVDV